VTDGDQSGAVKAVRTLAGEFTADAVVLHGTGRGQPARAGRRRRRAWPTGSGNPVLNPAVLVFLSLVAPWQFGLVRILIPEYVVVVMLIGWLSGWWLP